MKSSHPTILAGILAAALAPLCSQAADGAGTGVSSRSETTYGQWKNGPSTDPGYFPIAVWLQAPANAARYRAAGINVYVGLWRGPTSQQLRELEAAGMSVICSQNRVGLENRDNPVIIAWMHGDEPDNAQSLGPGKGWGPPILPEKIVDDYKRMRAADSTRPVLLNLGQGVAWDDYIGRGVRRNRPEDYPEYLKGCDIASFDIYPVVHDAPEIAGKLEFVAKGVARLAGWTRGEKPVWNCIECTHISNPQTKATPAQVRAEVWMALTHGSGGLIYFVHQFKPAFKEAALLDDPEMLAAVTAINRQIHELAPVLNSPEIPDGVRVSAELLSEGDASAGALPAQPRPVAWLHKQHAGVEYLLTVNMRNEPLRVKFTLASPGDRPDAEVLGEGRAVPIQNGELNDTFKPYEVHLYAIRPRPGR